LFKENVLSHTDKASRVILNDGPFSKIPKFLIIKFSRKMVCELCNKIWYNADVPELL
jgi:hypothetical protein